MPKSLARSANRPILIQRIALWWYAVALVPISGLGWLILSGLIPGIFAPLVLFALIFWVMSFVMALVARLRALTVAKPAPEPRQ